MTVQEFPALGFDPAPGDPGALADAARAVTGAGDVFGSAAANASRLNSSGWTGDAADAFRGQLADLPRDLDLAARSHLTAARALQEYGSGLVSRQRRATELESRAAALRQQESSAVAEVNRLAARTAPSGSAELESLKSQYNSARSRATSLGSDLQEVLAEARRLHTEHRTAADQASRAIRAATDAPYDEPGWLSRTWSSVKGWITKHADVLRGISSVLKGISAVLGVLSFVPGLQFLAPFAMGAAVAALLIDGALCLSGQGDWKSFALDAALTILPTGPVVRAFRRVPGVTRALDAAGDALSTSRLADRLPFLQRIPRSPLQDAGNPLPRLTEPRLTRDADGLVTHVDGTEVRDYLRATSTERASLTREALVGAEKKPGRSPAYSLTMDRETGQLFENVNTATKNMQLHDPLIRMRIDQSIADDVAHGRYQYSPNNPDDWGPHLHKSVPGQHAETYTASDALRYRRGARLPVSDVALSGGTLVTDVQNISKATPRPFPYCANCSRILPDVHSLPGRYPTFPPRGNLVMDVWPGGS